VSIFLFQILTGIVV